LSKISFSDNAQSNAGDNVELVKLDQVYQLNSTSGRRFEMKVRILVVLLIGVAILALIVKGVQAQDRNEPLLAVNNVLTALSSGEVDTAVTAFAENATAENRLRGESYRGLAQIRQMLQEMSANGRQYEINGYQQTGDTIIAQVEVSDRGLAWGTETILAEVQNGKLQAFNVTDFRLELWKLHR
jgi:hypothetical protein